MPILIYGFGILSWHITELKAINRKIRKLLAKGKCHHPKSNTHQLYLSRNKGDRGLIGAFNCHRQGCKSLAEYITATDDPLAKITYTMEQPKK